LRIWSSRRKAVQDYPAFFVAGLTWLDGVKIYGEKGLSAAGDWLSVKGVENIGAVKQAIKGAKS